MQTLGGLREAIVTSLTEADSAPADRFRLDVVRLRATG
jgi:hypothetical protein